MRYFKPSEKRLEAVRLRKQGLTYSEIMKAMDLKYISSVQQFLTLHDRDEEARCWYTGEEFKPLKYVTKPEFIYIGK